MRVIAGSAGGVRLAVPKRGVRPTMDRVKAAIFSSLGDAIIGAPVLDLFAGSGALGNEALSRGAASAIFVEDDRQSAEAIEKNLAQTKLKGRVRHQNAFDFVRQRSNAEKFQIIFADPPYEKTHRGERHFRFGEEAHRNSPSHEVLARSSAENLRLNRSAVSGADPQLMIRFIYNLFWPLGLLIFLPGYFAKMIRRGGYREKFGQRLGIYDGEVRNRLSNRRPTWLHAVSVGEVNIALKLASALRALEPDLHCVLTTTTTTGFALARKTAPRWIEVMYTPLDYWPIMRHAFSVIFAARIVLIEAEVWPNLAAAGYARRIPLALVNARLSPRSERRYRRFRVFVAPTFRLLDLVCVPERRDVERWAALGVPRNRMHVTGSIKFDADVQAQSHTTAVSVPALPKLNEGGSDAFSPDSLVLFGGSTHRGEEEILVRVFLRLREQFPSLRLFIAPRHVERLQEIRAHLGALPLRVTLASEALTCGAADADCMLLDTTGELQHWYGIATVVFIGKSLTAHGGQNPVEPILAGKPVVFGPHMENFATLAKRLLSKNGAIQVADSNSLESALAELLRDSKARQRLVLNAHEVLSEHRGATAREAALIHELCSDPGNNKL